MSEVKVTKRQLASELFDRMLAKREEGAFETNKAFRAATIQALQDELDISGSSACSMYGTNKKRVCDEDPTLGLGRDPKKAKAKVKPTVKPTAKAKVAPVVVADVDEDEILDRKVVNDTAGVVDLDPLAELDDIYGESDADFQDAVQDAIGGMDFDVGGGDYM